MKFIRLTLVTLSLVAILLALPTAARAAATNSVAAGKAHSAAGKTNSVAATNALLAIPVAAFELKVKPTKDPFFPLSLRQPISVATNAAPAFSAGNFALKGLSGAANERLALINNRTVAVGESAEITTPTGRVKIKCVDIKETSVIIRAESQAEELEIFLRKDLQ
jgi:hypothetical protein